MQQTATAASTWRRSFPAKGLPTVLWSRTYHRLRLPKLHNSGTRLPFSVGRTRGADEQDRQRAPARSPWTRSSAFGRRFGRFVVRKRVHSRLARLAGGRLAWKLPDIIRFILRPVASPLLAGAHSGRIARFKAGLLGV